MSEKEKTFPAPRGRAKPAPYRQAAPPAPSAPLDVVEAPRPSEKPLDVFDELEKVQIDPRALEEARSSNRSWGSVMIAFGLFVLIGCIALDVSAMSSHVYPSSSFIYLPAFGVILIVFGIRRFRLRGIEY